MDKIYPIRKTLELRFRTIDSLDVPFKQEHIDRMLKQPIGNLLYEYRNNQEMVIGRVIDTKFKEIKGNEVLFDCDCRIAEEFQDYVNPFVVMWED